MKKVLAIFLSLIMVCALFAACGEGGGETSDTKVAYVLTETGDTYSQGLGSSFKTAFEKAGGTVIQESFPKNTSDFSAYIQKAIDKKANVIFAPNSITVASNLIKQAADVGIEIPILAGDTWESSVILDAAKGTGLDVYCSTFFDENDNTTEYAAKFVSGFKAWLEEDNARKTENGGNTIVAAVSALGFDAYNVAYAAIEAAAAEKGEALTSVDVAKALWSLDYKEAVTGEIKFDKNGDAIKSSAYIKKAKADGSAFEFVKLQTVENNAEQGTAPAYDKSGIALDTANKKIVIGVYEPTSGDNAAGGKQEVLGAKYAKSLKPTIKIGDNEYTIELYVSDNASSEDKAVSAASAIVAQNALVSLGSYGSGVSIAAASTFADAGLPAIGVSCTNSAVTEGQDYYFRTCFLDPFQGSVMADFALSLINAK